VVSLESLRTGGDEVLTIVDHCSCDDGGISTGTHGANVEWFVVKGLDCFIEAEAIHGTIRQMLHHVLYLEDRFRRSVYTIPLFRCFSQETVTVFLARDVVLVWVIFTLRVVGVIRVITTSNKICQYAML
jgi:hypothetical protein